MQDTEPLLDLVHPGAVNGSKVKLKPGMFLEPFLDLFAMMSSDVVTNDMNQSDLRWNFPVYMIEKGDELLLSFAAAAPADDLSRPGIEGGKKIQGSVPFVLMFDEVGKVARFCWLCGANSRSRLEGGLFVERKDDFMGTERAGMRIDEGSNAFVEGFIPGVLCGEPHMAAPGLDFMVEENAANSLRRNARRQPLVNEPPCQFHTVPLRQGSPPDLRPLAGRLYQTRSRLRRGKKAACRGPVCP